MRRTLALIAAAFAVAACGSATLQPTPDLANLRQTIVAEVVSTLSVGTPTVASQPSAAPDMPSTPAFQATVTGAPPTTEASAATPAPTVALNAALAKLGETAELGGYSLTVVTVEDPAPYVDQYYTPEPGRKFVAVQITVGNVSGANMDTNPLRATLVDNGGFSYHPILGSLANKQLELVTLGPGEKVQGWIGFEVPESAVVASVKYETGYAGLVLQAGARP